MRHRDNHYYMLFWLRHANPFSHLAHKPLSLQPHRSKKWCLELFALGGLEQRLWRPFVYISCRIFIGYPIPRSVLQDLCMSRDRLLYLGPSPDQISQAYFKRASGLSVWKVSPAPDICKRSRNNMENSLTYWKGDICSYRVYSFKYFVQIWTEYKSENK